MATYLSDSVDGFGTASSTTITPSSAYTRTAGSLIVCAVRWETGDNTCTISDTSGQTWTSVTGSRLKHPSLALWTELFYAKNVSGSGSTTVTATFGTTSEYRSIIVLGFSGLDTSSPLDTSDTATPSSTNAPALGSALSVAGAGVTILTAGSYNSVTTFTDQNGFSDGTVSALNYQNLSYKIQSGSTSQTCSYSTTQTTSFCLIAASFLDAGGGGGGGVPKSTRLTLLGVG
jgi:hypothetical protein